MNNKNKMKKIISIMLCFWMMYAAQAQVQRATLQPGKPVKIVEKEKWLKRKLPKKWLKNWLLEIATPTAW
jgi:hypothetical protein